MIKCDLPKVSVIVPVYNVEKYIERCARSLFEQSLTDIEYIFVDDCSQDNSIAILLSTLDEYPNRSAQVRIVHHELNKGLASARNTGLELSKGEFIAHCDSDDWVDKYMYEKLYNKAKDSGSDVVLCDMYFIEKSQSSVFRSAEIGANNVETLNNYIVLPWTCTVNMLVDHNIYYRHKVKSPVGIAYCEDYHLTVRLLYYANKITRLSEPLYFYNRLNESSITHNLNDLQKESRCWCDLDIISFFAENNVLSKFEKSISIRMLNYMKYWVLDKNSWDKFQNFYPPSLCYIDQIKDITYWHSLILGFVARNNIFVANILYYLWRVRLKLTQLNII